MFNGYYCKIHLRLGDGAFIADADSLKGLAQDSMKLPDEARFNQDRITVPVYPEEVVVAADE
jgi:hypothetical protein